MGAWGYEPMDDDLAFEWLANEIAPPLLRTIKRTLQAYLEYTGEYDPKSIEAEAAVALLVDLTSGHAKLKYIDLDCSWLVKEDDWLAREGDVLALATTVIGKLLQDEQRLNDYNEPHEKRSVLKRLLIELQHCQERSSNR